MDYNKINEAVKLFIEGIGENPNREGLLKTPDRVTKMCEEIFSGVNQTTEKHLSIQFSTIEDEMVVVKDIEFYSVCEHHLLPFFGKIHIAYISNNKKIVGLSKIARVVEVYSRRLQLQENLTNQIANDIEQYLKPRGVMVIIDAQHMCMSMRGVKKNKCITSTYATRGCFDNNFENQKIFINMLGK